MKVVLVLFVCCVSVSWQQNPLYFGNYFPSWSPQFYASPALYPDQFKQPVFQQHFKKPTVNVDHDALQLFKSSQQSKLDNIGKPIPATTPEERAFGILKWFGLDNILDLAQTVGTALFTTTSTTSVTISTTLTIGTVQTCYTRTMFTSTTACRRKRQMLPGLMVGDDGTDAIVPSKVHALEPTAIERMLQESKTVEQEIHSSIQGDEATSNSPAINRFVRHPADKRDIDETVYVVTTTFTSYLFSYSTSVRTITNIASSTALTCLPACFTLC